MTLPRQLPCRGEFVLAEVAAADPDQRDEIDDFVVVEVVDQFAQLRLGRIVALVKMLLAVRPASSSAPGSGSSGKSLKSNARALRTMSWILSRPISALPARRLH